MKKFSFKTTLKVAIRSTETIFNKFDGKSDSVTQTNIKMEWDFPISLDEYVFFKNSSSLKKTG